MSFSMDRIWLNGEILPFSEAHLSYEDRGFQFGDGVYEVIRLYDGKPFRAPAAPGTAVAVGRRNPADPPMTPDGLAVEVQRLIDHVEVPSDACIYMQLTRGPSPRGHMFPEVAEPTLLFYAMTAPADPRPHRRRGRQADDGAG